MASGDRTGKVEETMRILVLAALGLIAACTTTSAGGGRLDIRAMQQRLDERGISFGVTRIPGVNSALFQVRFRISEADEATSEADFRAAAEAAAPEGCRLNRLEPAGEGAMKAVYDC
jgi:hypothetical protein